MKSILLIVLLLTANIYYAQDSYEAIRGTLVDKKYQEPIPNALVVLENQHKTYHTYTDFDGTFYFQEISIGTYYLSFVTEYSTINYPDSIGIDSNSLKILFVNMEMGPIKIISCSLQTQYTPPMYTYLNHEEIQESVNKFQTSDLILGPNSNILLSENSNLTVQGSNSDDCLILMDGVKTQKLHRLPASAIKSIIVMTGFIPAKYGDTTSGVLLIETMSYMDIQREREKNSD